ncbi:MAG: hypothetical protein IPP32_03440 [Bacteroidetes bacterium]|nr:hypothetical protein [Bacteroidota bacterium]
MINKIDTFGIVTKNTDGISKREAAGFIAITQKLKAVTMLYNKQIKQHA